MFRPRQSVYSFVVALCGASLLVGCGDAISATGGSAGAGGDTGSAGAAGSSGSGGDAGIGGGGSAGAGGNPGTGGSAGAGGGGSAGTAGSAGAGGTGGGPAPSRNFVTPSDVGQIVGVGQTSITLNGDQSLSSSGQVLENAVVNGCIRINADDVVIRNVRVNCNNDYPIKDNGNSGTRVERTTIDCMNNGTKGIYFDEARNFTVDGIEITRCDDQFFIDGGLGTSSISDSVFHNQAPANTAHTDGMHVGEFENTTGTLTVQGNWWEYNRQGCCENAVLFLSSHSALNVNLARNFFDADFGTHILRCRVESNCVVEHNTLGGEPAGLFVQSSDSGAGSARCNRFADQSFVPASFYAGVTVDNSNCEQ